MKASTFIVGISLSVFVHTAVGLSLYLASGARADVESNPDASVLPEEDVIAAEIIALGEELPDDQLPNRVVPQLATAPSNEEVVSAKRDVVKRDRKERQAHAEVDPLEHLAKRSEIFGEQADPMPIEGSADGEEGGVRSVDGDRYKGKLIAFARKGWTVPKTLDQDVLNELKCVARVSFDDEMRVVAFSLSKKSGDADFDDSVSAQLMRIKESGALAPQPPLEVAERYRSSSIRVTFHGKRGAKK